MLRLLGFLAAVLGAVSAARGQRFGFTHRMVPADDEPAGAVALGDLDGDGDLDAYVGNWGQDRLYRNAGSGHLTDVTATSLPPLLDATLAVALGDVDGDGDLDAFVGNGLTQETQAVHLNRLHLNDGTGVFTDVTAANLPAILGNTRAVSLGDVDGDGDLDAFAGNAGQSRLYSNGGTGVFTDVSATNLPPLPFSYTRAVALGDVNGDGDLDAFVGNENFPDDRLLLNGGTGLFTAGNLPASGADTFAVAFGDVDGDSDLDALLGSWGQRLYRNNGGVGWFTDVTATSLPASTAFTGAVALGDVEGDGDLDAFAGTAAQSRLYSNGGTGVFTDVSATNLPPLPFASTPAVALGDMDGDGDLDAFLGATWQDRLYLNGGTGAFTDVTATSPPTMNNTTMAVALGDVDGDGDLDAFVGNQLPPTGLHFNDGTGVFTAAPLPNLPNLFNYTRGVALGDVDGDGDLDAFVGNEDPPIGGPMLNRLYVNGGTGIFTDVTATNLPFLASPPFTTAVALGDVDGDGDLDALLAESHPLGLSGGRLYLNGGTGIFTNATATNFPAPSFRVAIALGDVDGDGDLDAYLGGSFDALLQNGGTGVFSFGSLSLPPSAGPTTAVAFGDVDGDGDLDALVGRGGQDRLYSNGGTGAFTDVTATNLPATSPSFARAVALGDVDGDGDLDAFAGGEVANGTGGQDRLYLNGGTGVFMDATATDLPALVDSTRAVALGDLDGDGDLDAFVGNLGPNRLYTNLSRQLAWVETPRTGRPLTLDVRGPAGGAWILGVSLAPAEIPLPPFGTLRLHPATLFVVGSGAFDPQGRATLSFLVPANPALIGLPVYYQAVVGLPIRFTNLEITAAVDL